MRPIEQSPLLQIFRGEQPAAIVWLLSAFFFAAAYLLGSRWELWDGFVDPGPYVCFDAATACEAPETDVHVVGELVTFTLFALGGISAWIAAGLSFLRPRQD